MVDLDPQSNLTLQCIATEDLEKLWNDEEPYVTDFQAALDGAVVPFKEFVSTPRSVHCLLKPIEDGVSEAFTLGAIHQVAPNLGLIPGRLSLHTFEDKLARSWNDAFMGEPQALRLLTAIRGLCLEAEKQHGYQVAILDTSPSLGLMNRVIISMSTGFFVPCMPDMFSTFGLVNIGHALRTWRGQFETMYGLLSDRKRAAFPKHFVRFLGYTIYNSKKYAGQNELDLADADYGYARRLPAVVLDRIPKEAFAHLTDEIVSKPIGGTAIMHSHNTLPKMAQKYRVPMWAVPALGSLGHEDRPTIAGNSKNYIDKREMYQSFAVDLMSRLDGVDD
jgi:cellulose biosynthesis protein BcsQ